MSDTVTGTTKLLPTNALALGNETETVAKDAVVLRPCGSAASCDGLTVANSSDVNPPVDRENPLSEHGPSDSVDEIKISANVSFPMPRTDGADAQRYIVIAVNTMTRTFTFLVFAGVILIRSLEFELWPSYRKTDSDRIKLVLKVAGALAPPRPRSL